MERKPGGLGRNGRLHGSAPSSGERVRHGRRIQGGYFFTQPVETLDKKSYDFQYCSFYKCKKDVTRREERLNVRFAMRVGHGVDEDVVGVFQVEMRRVRA